MTTQEITVRVSKTIQEQQYEPLTVDLAVTETCPKKKYDERLAELTDLLKEEAYAALGLVSNQSEEVQQSEEALPEEGGEGSIGGNFEEDEPLEVGEEFEETTEFEKNGESGEFEESEESGEDEFGDFFDDDPGGDPD